MKSKFLEYQTESGQTLAAIFVFMVLALSIGVGITSRFIKTMRSSTETDFSSRAVGVAEAGAERILLESYETLSDYIDEGTCGDDCYLEFTGTQGLVSTATISLSYLGGLEGPSLVSLPENEVREVYLLGYADNQPIWFCWGDASDTSIVGMQFHGNTGSYGVDNFACNSIGGDHSENGFDIASSLFGYQNCCEVPGASDPQFVRVRSVYGEVNVSVVPQIGFSLPSQGILIESRGTVGGVTKIARILKTRSYLPIIPPWPG